MNIVSFSINKKKLLGDIITPVSVYMNLRKRFPNTILLESSDYNSIENASSFIGINPIAEISIKQSIIYERIFTNKKRIKTKNRNEILDRLQHFFSRFKLENKCYTQKSNAIFGYITYDAVQYFENIFLKNKQDYDIPDIHFSLFKYVIEFKHFTNEVIVIELVHEKCKFYSISDLIKILYEKISENSSFLTVGEEIPNMSDKDFIKIVNLCRKHCMRGDVFQIVPSRRFKQQFSGNDFSVYRALRSINPSPYQFYFDYGDIHLFGSSPETQIKIKDNKAYIFPIAGTFKRSNNELEDFKLAQKLKKDPKEKAEHTMLVDLARNDLSRNGRNIKIEKFSEIQFFSHVIHLVSKVSAEINFSENNYFNIVSDTFPAGTLSGAPKYKAMQLIDEMEPTSRRFYGGTVGTVSFNNEIDLAIMIRSFLSKDNVLYYQAGAGVVEKSVAINELNEVNNKLAALRKAINVAQRIVK